jgi:nitroreductase
MAFFIDAVHTGIRKNREGKSSLYNFRRNIHRLEKALSFKKPKEVFAEGYILETIQYYKDLVAMNSCDQNTIIWGKAVLDLFFGHCKKSPLIEDAFRHYHQIESNILKEGWHPYAESTRPALAVKYEDLLSLAKRRRSVRHFTDKKVEVDEIEKAMVVASFSPSACNRQSYRFLFYNNTEIVDKIASIPGGVAGYTVPSIVVVTCSYGAYFDERDIPVPIIDSSLAVMSFILALETLGLASVCINWPCLVEHEKSIRKIIKIDDDEIIIVLVGIGYPDPEGKIPYSAKKDMENLLFCNKAINGSPV